MLGRILPIIAALVMTVVQPATAFAAPPDKHAPGIPSNLAASGITTTGFTVNWSSSTDNVGVTGYEVSLNGAGQGTVTTTSKVFTGLAAGVSYSITVRARDAAGNWSAQSQALVVTTVEDPTAPTVPANSDISVAYGHVTVLKGDGTVWGWGANTCDGTLWGNIVPGMYKSPIRVPSISTATAVSDGGYHTLVLKQDGTVLAFGYGDAALGGGSSSSPIPRLTGIKSVSAGGSHSLAVSKSGTLYAWGTNTFGQIGNNKTTDVTSPTQLNKITGIVQAAAGGSHSLALKSDGTVLAWGNNAYGQLGIGSEVEQHVPVAIAGLTGVTQLVAVGAHSYALKSDGTVWAWGLNSHGEVGDGTQVTRNRPTQVTGLSGVVALSGGLTHALALKNDGSLWAWGSNAEGQLGDGTVVDRSLPVRVTVVNSAIRIAAGGYNSYAVLADGTIRSWGKFADSMLGDGGNLVLACPFVDVAQIAYGWNADLFVTRVDGSVWGWGPNREGELGDSTNRSYDAPIQIPGLTGIVYANHSIALRNDGTVWTWGKNGAGQLGDGTLADRYFAAQVPGITGVVQVAIGSGANGAFCMALKSDGTVWTWGDNTYGQLGDGTNIAKTSPVQVPGLTSVTWIAAGGPNAFAVQANGTSWAWGYDWFVFGAGTGVSTNVPIQTLARNVSKIATNGRGHTLFLTKLGSVYICGNDSMSAYGGGWWGSNSPLLVNGVDSVVEVTASGYSVARSANGKIWRFTDAGPQLLTDVEDVQQIRSVSGAGVVYNNGSVRFWEGMPRVQPLGFATTASQVADFRLGSSSLDTDNDGLPDAWELQVFGDLGHTAAADDDGDGLTNIQEYLRATDPNQASTDGDRLFDSVDPYPTDYYNAQPPLLAKLNGDNQLGEVGTFNVAPFDVAVWHGDGSAPFVNAPIFFSVVAGGGKLSINRSGSAPLLPSLSLVTDADGSAKVYYNQPATAGAISRITATAGVAQVSFTTTSTLSGDSDGDGLIDTWEQQYLGTLSFTGSDDPGRLGRTLTQSAQLDASPWPPAEVSTGLRAWYNAELGVSEDASGNVDRWTDLSGNGAHARASATSAEPMMIPSAIAGKPAVQFAGAQNLTTAGPVDVQGGSTDMTMIAVVRPTAGQSAGAEIFTYGGDAHPGVGLVAETATRFGLHWLDSGGSEQRSANIALTTDQVQIVTVVKEASSVYTFRNGTASGSAAVPAGVLTLMGKVALGQRFSGQIAELLVYNRAINTTEREQIESALALRYSIPVGSIPDTDGDGLSDADEDLLGTNKLQADHPDVQLVVTQPAKRTP